MIHDRTTDSPDPKPLACELALLGEMLFRRPRPDSSQLRGQFSAVLASLARRKRIHEQVMESLSDLRMEMTYLLFDLEATRRERDALREQSGGGDDVAT